MVVGAHHEKTVVWADELGVSAGLIEEDELLLKESDLVDDLVLEHHNIGVFGNDVIARALGLAQVGGVVSELEDVLGLDGNVLEIQNNLVQQELPAMVDFKFSIGHDGASASSTTLADLWELDSHCQVLGLEAVSDGINSFLNTLTTGKDVSEGGPGDLSKSLIDFGVGDSGERGKCK